MTLDEFMSDRDGASVAERDAFVRSVPGLESMLMRMGDELRAVAPSARLDLSFFRWDSRNGKGDVELLADVPRDEALFMRLGESYPAYCRAARNGPLDDLARRQNAELEAHGFASVALVCVYY